jgi:ABC-type Mn2+/Zn2+ transport system ATPase subunit
MQNYSVILSSVVSESFRCSMAAQSVDFDPKSKSVHKFNVAADLDSPWSVGLIVGASGSGKTTLAKKIFGDDCFDFKIDETKPIIEQFPEELSYNECQSALMGVGLTQVPCWIRPVYTLSNGQKARAIAALQMATNDSFVVDEWTSVVDRTVAKAMSNCLSKHARRINKRICAVSCHYDVAEWLNPDWIIDCNKQTYTDRRLLWQNFKRSEQLEFTIREINSSSWRYFSKYHYLSDKVPGGKTVFFGLFCNDEQIGFQCFANYTPHRDKRTKMQMHSNRTVIHPDYVGLGLGIKLINLTSKIMHDKGFDVRAKFSSTPVAKAFEKCSEWKLQSVQRFTGKPNIGVRQTGFRNAVKTYSYAYKPKSVT